MKNIGIWLSNHCMDKLTVVPLENGTFNAIIHRYNKENMSFEIVRDFAVNARTFEEAIGDLNLHMSK